MDHFNIAIFAGALALAIAGTYVIWGPSTKSKRKNKVPGLQNLGNSCFVNAIMQALAACPMFIQWLKTILHLQKTSDQSLITTLLTILVDLNSNSGICSAEKFINALRSHRWVISNEEQDAHEFFHALTTTLEENLIDIRPVLSLLEVSKLENVSNIVQSDVPHKVFVRSSNTSCLKNNHPFRGLLANQIICKQCKHKYPVKYDTFDSISLSIPTPSWGPLTLQNCIQKFVSCEQICDVTCDMCKEIQKSKLTSENTPPASKDTPFTSEDTPFTSENTPSASEDTPSTSENTPTSEDAHKSTFIKQLSFGKLPECLCFHIQRTIWLSNGAPKKCFDYLMFPEFLIMDNFVYKCPNKKDSANAHNGKLIGGNSQKHESIQRNGSVCDPVIDPVHSQTQLSTNKSYLALLAENGLPSGDHIYLLKAVIVHLGDLLSGHFVTYRRGAINTCMQRNWYLTSDLSTKEVPFSEVKKVCAYMLFYEKIPSV